MSTALRFLMGIRRRRSITILLLLLVGCSTSSGGSSDPALTAPAPTTADAVTVAPQKSMPDSTTTPVTTSPAIASPTTSSSTTTDSPTTAPATTEPTGAVAVGGEPFLVDIPGKMIDYVPDVAANLNIDVPGQYYEILPKFYVFIPTQTSTTNPNLQAPAPADRPILEAYTRAVAEIWKVYTTDPIPAEGTPELRTAFTPRGWDGYLEILADAARRQIHTEVRGNAIVPRVGAKRSDSSALVVDCGWLDQSDVDNSGELVEDWNRSDSGSADVVKSGPTWLVARLESDAQGCS